MRRLGLVIWLMGISGYAAATPLEAGQCIVLQLQQPDGATSVQVVEIRGEGKGGYYLRLWVDHRWEEPWLSIDLNMSKTQLERLERIACPK